jgi:hypothetical protein
MAFLGSSESYGFARFIRRKGLSQRKNKVKRLLCPWGWWEYSTDGRWGQVEDYERIRWKKPEPELKLLSVTWSASPPEELRRSPLETDVAKQRPFFYA